jgi:hypothetical protein
VVCTLINHSDHLNDYVGRIIPVVESLGISETQKNCYGNTGDTKGETAGNWLDSGRQNALPKGGQKRLNS